MKHLHFEEIDSTNLYLKREYQNSDNLTFVSASYQSNGHGRFSRIWEASKDKSLLFSFLLKDKKYIDNFSYISMMTAALVVKYLQDKGIKNVSIKWPNDVYANDKKIAGILLEGEMPNYLVVGVGINLNQKSFNDDELRHPATSMSLELLNKKFDFKDELKVIISLIYNFLSHLGNDWHILDDFIATHNYLAGRHVRVLNTLQKLDGEVVGIDSECNLLIKKEKEIVKINSGEIEIL